MVCIINPLQNPEKNLVTTKASLDIFYIMPEWDYVGLLGHGKENHREVKVSA